MRFCRTKKSIIIILLIALYVQDVYCGCIKIHKAGKKNAKEKQTTKDNDSKTCHNPDNWPNSAAAESFPALIKTKRLKKGWEPIKFKKVQRALLTHREEMHAYHITNGNYAATHAINSAWSQSQIARDAEQMKDKSNS